MTYIDIHVLQTVPPSNLNRDDTGSPKTALFGGARRVRVSSQAWKRATRKAYESRIDEVLRGVRTKRVHQLLCERIHRINGAIEDDEVRDRAAKVLTALGLKPDAKQNKAAANAAENGETPYDLTQYLIFLSNDQLDRLAELGAAYDGDKPDAKAVKAAADQGHGVDVALFGRMVADSADLNVDAAVQVAHALSTHPVDLEQDYFTAVDDTNPDEETGAGMIGTVEFDSATLYRYATINLAGLVANIGDTEVVGRAAEEFVRAFVTSMPTGKQNTFANRTVPDAVVVMIRRDQPVNLVGAFEQAVTGSDGYVEASARALRDHAKGVNDIVAEPEATLVCRANAAAGALDDLGRRVTLDELVGEVGVAARSENAANSSGQ